MTSEPRKSKRRFWLLDTNNQPTGKVFRSVKPRGAALKAANRGITDIALFDQDRIERFEGSRTPKPLRGRASWAMGLEMYDSGIRKLGTELLTEEEARHIAEQCERCEAERDQRRQATKDARPDASAPQSLARLLEAVAALKDTDPGTPLVKQLCEGRGTSSETPLTDISVSSVHALIQGTLGWTVSGNHLSRRGPGTAVDTIYVGPSATSAPEVLLYLAAKIE